MVDEVLVRVSLRREPLEDGRGSGDGGGGHSCTCTCPSGVLLDRDLGLPSFSLSRQGRFTNGGKQNPQIHLLVREGGGGIPLDPEQR